MQYVSEYSIINYQESDAELVSDLAEYLDNNAAPIYDFFGVTDKQKAIINIIPTKQEFDKIFREKRGLPDDYELGKWVRGTGCPNGDIDYLSINDYDNTTHRFDPKDYDKALIGYKKTLVHEYVHFVNQLFNKQNNCSYTALYLVEGIAVYLSRQTEEWARVAFDASLEQLVNHESCGYGNYYLLTKELLTHYDRDFVLNLFTSSREANEFLVSTLYEETKSNLPAFEQQKS